MLLQYFRRYIRKHVVSVKMLLYFSGQIGYYSLVVKVIINNISFSSICTLTILLCKNCSRKFYYLITKKNLSRSNN